MSIDALDLKDRSHRDGLLDNQQAMFMDTARVIKHGMFRVKPYNSLDPSYDAIVRNSSKITYYMTVLNINMSVEEDVPEIVSEFPAPPKFFALYADGVESGPLPPEPMVPTYHMFGSPYSTQDVVPDLLPQPSKKLYGPQGEDGDSDGISIDYKTEMKKINCSLLANFVELVDVLIKKPAMFNEKLDDVELLFLNLHNLINAFRPHQARETVIQMLRTQVQERRDAAREIRRTIDKSRQAVERVHGELHNSAEDAAVIDEVAPAGIDIDVKMENVDRIGAIGNGIDLAKAPDGSAAVLTQFQKEQTEKAREARLMQEQFFAKLEAAMN